MNPLLCLGLVVLAVLALCVLSKMASSNSPHSQFGAGPVRHVALSLLRDAELARVAAAQDSLATLALFHSVEYRVCAQTAKRVAESQGFADIAKEALEMERAAKLEEDAALQELAERAGDV